MTNATLTQDEWSKVQEDLRNHVDTFRDTYGESGARGQEIRHEDDNVVIFADSSGQELNEIAEIVGVDRDALSQRMHKEARKHYTDDNPGDEWSVVDPIAVFKNK